MLPGIRIAADLLTGVDRHIRSLGQTPLWEVNMNLKALELLFGAGYVSVEDFEAALDFDLLSIPKLTPGLLEEARQSAELWRIERGEP